MQQSAADASPLTGGEGGYDINIGDDDDELYLMSKRKGNGSNRFKAALRGRDGHKNLND